jgi:hypothetical protein
MGIVTSRTDGTVAGAALAKGALHDPRWISFRYVTQIDYYGYILTWLSTPAQPTRNKNCFASPLWRGFSCTIWL